MRALTRFGAPAVLLAACAGDPAPAEVPAPGACDGGASELYVVQTLRFVRADPEDAGVSDGFDLDGLGAEACGIDDFVAPDGTPDIDNAFAYLLPVLELTEAAAVESLVQAAIENGQLLLTLELDGVSDPLDDACVDVTIGRATGTPLLGTDGKLLVGQTLAPDPDRPSTTIEDAAFVDGTVQVPIELTLPLQVFDVSLDFALLDGQLRLSRGEDGTVYGLFAGGVEGAYLVSVAEEENVDDALAGVLGALLATWSDLAPDAAGTCTRVSITFAFEAVPAFWYPE